MIFSPLKWFFLGGARQAFPRLWDGLSERLRGNRFIHASVQQPLSPQNNVAARTRAVFQGQHCVGGERGWRVLLTGVNTFVDAPC